MTHSLLYNEETLILVILRKWPQKVKYLTAALFHNHGNFYSFNKSNMKNCHFNKFLWSNSGTKSKTFGTKRILIVFIILKCFKTSQKKGLIFETPGTSQNVYTFCHQWIGSHILQIKLDSFFKYSVSNVIMDKLILHFMKYNKHLIFYIDAILLCAIVQKLLYHVIISSINYLPLNVGI